MNFSTDINKTAGKITEKSSVNTDEKTQVGVSNGAIAIEQLNAINSNFNSAIQNTGAKTSEGWQSAFKNALDFAWNGIQKTVATGLGAVTSVFKGVCGLIEGLSDLGVIIGTAVASSVTGLYDLGSYFGNLITGEKENWESATAKMWKDTMAHVSKDLTKNAFSDFYKNNVIGQFIDEKAIDLFKSEGIGSKVTEGIGYVAGVVLVTIGTLGIGTVAMGVSTAGAGGTTAISSIIAGMAGTGNYTGEYWANARDKSWEGMMSSYENGEITEEQFNSIQMIRNLTEKDWKEIEQDYKNGTMSKEQFEMMKQIREMPENWTTLKNALKGTVFGAANGIWETIQWYVGGKLGNWTLKEGSKLATSAVRVGVDTAFNALDTPFRTTVDSATSDKTWIEAWTEQGGWINVLSNTLVGLVGSVGGEAFDNVKINKELFNDYIKEHDIDILNMSRSNIKKIKEGIQKLNTDALFKNMDESTANAIKTKIMDEHITGIIDLTKMSNKDLSMYINKTKRKIVYQPPMKLTEGSELLNLPSWIKFGLELEAQNVDGLKLKKNFKKTGWHVDEDASLTDLGAEAVSPVLSEAKSSKVWDEIQKICKLMKENPKDTSRKVYIDDKCGGHIHFDAQIFAENPRMMQNFLRLWSESEELVYKMCNEQNDPIRPGAINSTKVTWRDIGNTLTNDFLHNAKDNISNASRKLNEKLLSGNLHKNGMAAPIGPKIEHQIKINKLKLGKPKSKLYKQLIKLKLTPERFEGLNLTNIGNKKKNTVEFRMSNGTLNPKTIKENVFLYASIIDTSLKITEDPLKVQKKLDKFYRVDLTEEEKLDAFLELIMNNPEDRNVYKKRWASVKDSLVFNSKGAKNFRQNIFKR